MSSIVCLLLTAFMIAVFARILLSWVRVSPGSGLAPIAGFIHQVTEPVMGPLRRAIPPVRLGGGAIDFSPIIVIFGVSFIQAAIC